MTMKEGIPSCVAIVELGCVGLALASVFGEPVRKIGFEGIFSALKGVDEAMKYGVVQMGKNIRTEAEAEFLGKLLESSQPTPGHTSLWPECIVSVATMRRPDVSWKQCFTWET